MLISLPATVNAGIFSTISLKIFGGGDETYIEDSENVYNSQNIPVLNSTVGISSNKALGGGGITIVDGVALYSDSGTSGVTVDTDEAPNQGKISIYEVREGDTLSQIAEMFDVSVNTIRWANDLEGAIQPGEILVILPVTGIKHVVKYGGTIEDVAEIYKADVTEIALFNGLDVDVVLEPGDEVIVPHVDPVSDGDQDSRSDDKPNVYVNAPSSKNTGYYINPLPGEILTQNTHGYNAVDIGAPYGTPILASATGRVIKSKEGGWNGGYGNYVVMTHPNGTQTVYAHMSSNNVAVGQTVAIGEVVGYVGSTGNSTGNHLHFEIRGAYNPLTVCKVQARCYAAVR